jgi:cryptochrome
VPTMEELGLKDATSQHRGGETIALKVLDEVIANKQYTATFEKPKTAPTAFAPQSTTLLSPHLHFGSLSVREFYWQCQDVVDGYGPKASQPPTSLTGQLLFRDMYFGAQAKLGWKFGQTVGNPQCRFIPWHLPSKVDSTTGLITGEYVKSSEQAEDWFQRWRNGTTGFPWIDAIMRQLKQEGWIHHLARHAVACFLTRGGCYISWERGAEVFEEWLIDHEAACNIGNWQWLSCTAFYSQFYRCYSPIAFPQNTDKEGNFVRHFVPELSKYPTKYIYEPWKAPIATQKEAGCLVKGHGSETQGEANMKMYPKPMFDFPERRNICLDGMKSAYQTRLYGSDPKVLDGTWKQLFDDKAEGPTEGKSEKDGKTNGSSDMKKPADHSSKDAIDEDERGAADQGGEGEDKKINGSKRKRGKVQGSLDRHVKKSKT